ncbi:undecaprenyl-diphosphate phosphatase [Nereida sp. NH-UV-3]|uniref:undecaprenyl-diphosphate phosphatase n=1 Tax=Nereida TaxID=282198 RepID=UPI0036F2CD1C
MPLYYLVIIALIQGITEFLPVSSSGHLILLPSLTGAEDQGQVIDVAAHFGTLFAVIAFFWADVRSAAIGLPKAMIGHNTTQGERLAQLLIIATIPVVIAGFALKMSGYNDALRNITVIGWTMIIFGIVLWYFDTKSPSIKNTPDWTRKDAAIMGLWQAIALIPGVSRSGATISGARALGYTRSDGAKLAMLMSIPTIIASATLLTLSLDAKSSATLWRDILIVAALSFGAALVALSLMMKLLKSVSFTPYVIYRIALGAVLLVIAYT